MDAMTIQENTEILAFAEYNEFEAAADRTAIKIKEGFMEMGYILKIARDTDILAGSGYQNHEEFAQQRYDLDKGTVSRYIRIVERFSEGGNSHILKENYKKMGFAKLSLMLHMPDAIAEELMDSLSKQEVLAIKEELDAESMVSDIELAIEKSEETDASPAAVVRDPDESLFVSAVYQYGKENPDTYRKLWEAVKNNDYQRIPDILAPQGDATIFVRIPGTGRIMMAIQGKEVSATAVRTQEKERCTMEDLIPAFVALCQSTETTAEDTFRLMYGIEMAKEPEKPDDSKVAPVQTPKRKESKVTKAKDVTKKIAKGETNEPSEQEETVGEIPEGDAGEETSAKPGGVDGENFGQEESRTEGEQGDADQSCEGVSPGPGSSEDDERVEEPQIPGQDNIMNHPEHLPEGMKAQSESENTQKDSDMPSAAAMGIMGMSTDAEWQQSWGHMKDTVISLLAFIERYSREDLVNNRIDRVTLEFKYQEALYLAASLERIINGKKYHAE